MLYSFLYGQLTRLMHQVRELVDYAFFDSLSNISTEPVVLAPQHIGSTLTAKTIDFSIYQELLTLFGSRVPEDTIRKRLMQHGYVEIICLHNPS